MEIYKRFSGYSAALITYCLLSNCANQEVQSQLNNSIENRGVSYAKELATQSPFQKVSLSWDDAKQLMKERNSSYKKAISAKIEAESTGNLVTDFTNEVRKSLKKTASRTINPREIAKAFQNPITQLPRQIESLTDLKNISHSLEQKEWNRVSDSVAAQVMSRAETVKLHVLFCQNKVLNEQLELLKHYEPLVAERAPLVSALKKKKERYNKQRSIWLDSIRDFFNAEYYDVEFKNYGRGLSLYRDVEDPNFDQWQRWRTLDHSQALVKELQNQHKKSKPVIPGVNGLKSSLGLKSLQDNLADNPVSEDDMRKEVRSLLKQWRELKETQSKISELKSRHSSLPMTSESITLKTIDTRFQVFQLLEKEIKIVRNFWLIDEQCWDS